MYTYIALHMNASHLNIDFTTFEHKYTTRSMVFFLWSDNFLES